MWLTVEKRSLLLLVPVLMRLEKYEDLAVVRSFFKKYSFVVRDGEISDIKVSGSDVSTAD